MTRILIQSCRRINRNAEESRGRLGGMHDRGCTSLGAGRVRGVRLARCGYQRGERRRLAPKRGSPVGDERLRGPQREIPRWGPLASEDGAPEPLGRGGPLGGLRGAERPANNRATTLLSPLSAGIPKAIDAPPLGFAGTPPPREEAAGTAMHLDLGLDTPSRLYYSQRRCGGTHFWHPV